MQKNFEMGRKQLAQTEKIAHLKGFELIARKATISRAATELAAKAASR